MENAAHKEHESALSSLFDFAVANNNKLVLCKDGTAWMARRMDFVDIMESENYGFGTTIEEAVIGLLKIEENEFEKNRGKESFVSRWKVRFGLK